jgi:hypothetical protein
MCRALDAVAGPQILDQLDRYLDELCELGAPDQFLIPIHVLSCASRAWC